MKKLLIIIFFLTQFTALSVKRYELKTDYLLLDVSYEILMNQVGVKEKQSNWGHPIIDYLASVGIYFPAAYCMGGQYYCVEEASEITGIENPLLKTGGVLKQWNHFVSRGVETEYIPEIHDLIFWQNYTRINGKLRAKGTGHVERIKRLLQKGWVETIGFNTSSGLTGSQRDGGGVYPRKRHLYNPISLLFVKGLGGFEYE